MGGNDQEVLRLLRTMSGQLESSANFMREEAEKGDAKKLNRADSKTDPALEKTRKALKSTGDAYLDSLADQLKNIKSANKYFSKSIDERASLYEDMYDKVKAGTITQEEYNKRSQKAFGEIIDHTKVSKKKMLEADKAAHKEFAENMSGAADAAKDAEKSLRELAQESATLMLAFSAMKHFGKEAYDVAKVMTSTGAEFTATQVKNALLLGMSTSELMSLTAGYSQTMKSAQMSTNQFSNYLNDKVTLRLVGLSGGLTEATKFVAESAHMYRLAGAGAGTMGEFLESQQSQFGKLQSMTGMTIEEFSKLNTALMANSDLQGKMFKMNKEQQTVYVKELAVRRNALIQQGLQADQADAVIASMAKMNGGDAKTRLKEAAKLQATMGAMGMGQQGKEAADIMRLGSRATADQVARLDEIMVSVNKESSRRGQGSLQSEMVQDMFNSLNPMMGPDSPLAAAVNQSALAIQQPLEVIQDDAKTAAADATAQRSSIYQGLLGGIGLNAETIVAAGDMAIAAMKNNMVLGVKDGLLAIGTGAWQLLMSTNSLAQTGLLRTIAMKVGMGGFGGGPDIDVDGPDRDRNNRNNRNNRGGNNRPRPRGRFGRMLNGMRGAGQWMGTAGSNALGSIGNGLRGAAGMLGKGAGAVGNGLRSMGGMAANGLRGAAGMMGGLASGAGGMMGGIGGAALRGAGAVIASPAAAVAGAGMLGWEIGKVINTQLSDETKETIGGTISELVGSATDGSLIKDATSYWGSFFGMGGDSADKAADITESAEAMATKLNAAVASIEPTKEEIQQRKDATEMMNAKMAGYMEKLDAKFGDMLTVANEQIKLAREQKEVDMEAADRTVEAIESTTKPGLKSR